MPAAAGRYKSKRFRSLLELSYLRQVEYEDVSVFDELQVEPFRIRYRMGRGKSRDYVPDFFIPSTKVLIEVKPGSRRGSRMNVAKFAAAERFCMEHDYRFVVVTETDLFEVMKFKDVAHDPDIIWSEGTKKRRRFKRVLKGKKGKKKR